MTAAVAVAPVAPVMAASSVRSEQVTQLVLGEMATVLAAEGEWRRIRTEADAYEGWINRGYLKELNDVAADEWRRHATAVSLGARVSVGSDLAVVPLRARVVSDDGLWLLPDGRAGRLFDGEIQDVDTATRAARAVSAEEWALQHFRGAPYQWGGVTPLGVDCSGLVQTTLAFRGLQVPRDSSKQVTVGAEVSLESVAPGDLLFFRSENSGGITHVAFAAAGNTLVHSTISCGSVLRESFEAGSRAGIALRPLFVAARRIGS